MNKIPKFLYYSIRAQVMLYLDFYVQDAAIDKIMDLICTCLSSPEEIKSCLKDESNKLER